METRSGRELGMMKRSGTSGGACAMASGATETWKMADCGCIVGTCGTGSTDEIRGAGKLLLLLVVTLVLTLDELLLLRQGDNPWCINDLMSIVVVGNRPSVSDDASLGGK
uniref:Uncharacterized protein n=1 Tax=Hyaloperonospora arabidopsidis (strain Emoy2) TaxID=559515 RepID=M4BRS1_HYAAE